MRLERGHVHHGPGVHIWVLDGHVCGCAALHGVVRGLFRTLKAWKHNAIRQSAGRTGP